LRWAATARIISGMGRPRRQRIREEHLHGFKHFKLLTPILERLHDHGCSCDRAGNRILHYDQYAALILLYFFNPIVTSLRGIQQASELTKVQRLLGCPRAALGSLSEAARVFDEDLLVGIIGELVQKLSPIRQDPPSTRSRPSRWWTAACCPPCLLVAAMWRDERTASRCTPTSSCRECRYAWTDRRQHQRAEVLKACLQPDRVYVMDRGYVEFALFQQILAAGSSFVCRLPDSTVFEVLQERELSREALAAGLVRDAVVRFSGKPATDLGLRRPFRIVEVECTPHRKPSGHTGRGGPEQGDTILIATDILDAPPEVIALIYKHRWAIETFFRFFKHVLGCRHLLSHCTNGIEIQTYLGIIACLHALWTG
jgi:hypothetical protein